jgi:transcriptional regulator with XRE-family HTH domain
MADMVQTVGAAIRKRRQARGLSVHALGRMAGMDASMLSKVERGIVQTSLDRYVLLAEALEVPISTLFRRQAA